MQKIIRAVQEAHKALGANAYGSRPLSVEGRKKLVEARRQIERIDLAALRSQQSPREIDAASLASHMIRPTPEGVELMMNLATLKGGLDIYTHHTDETLETQESLGKLFRDLKRGGFFKPNERPRE